MPIETIRNIWQSELALSSFSDEDDFFALGGHSLIMTQIQLKIKEQIGVEVSMDELFRHLTVKELAEYLTAKESLIAS